MVDFSNIKTKAAVAPEVTREYFFDTLEGEPSLIVAPAHDENPAFLDERLRLATERAKTMANEPRRRTKVEEISPDFIKKQQEEDRDYDRRILAAVCVKGWGENPPKDAAGKVPKFSEANALAFLEALPNYILDPFRAYCSNIYNFVERPKRTPEDDAPLGE